jgi:hypothetical protein
MKEKVWVMQLEGFKNQKGKCGFAIVEGTIWDKARQK